MGDEEAISKPPVIILHKRGPEEVFWQAALSVSDSRLTKTSKLNVQKGTVNGPDAEASATDLAFKAICKMCKDKGVPLPALSDCVVQNAE